MIELSLIIQFCALAICFLHFWHFRILYLASAIISSLKSSISCLHFLHILSSAMFNDQDYFISFKASLIIISVLSMFGESAMTLSKSASVFEALNQTNEFLLSITFRLPSFDFLVL